jgi:hypothetical protein
LSDALRLRGAATVNYEGKRYSAGRFVARMLWELATLGITHFANGTELRAKNIGWFEIVRFIYAQVDGPPRAQVDVTTDGEPIGLTDAEVIAAIGGLLDAGRTRAAAQASAGSAVPVDAAREASPADTAG